MIAAPELDPAAPIAAPMIAENEDPSIEPCTAATVAAQIAASAISVVARIWISLILTGLRSATELAECLAADAEHPSAEEGAKREKQRAIPVLLGHD